ncbi:MAG: UbiA family prenyltransferase, partial [Thermodesulfobacteriota bacterium]|nr:UbiA family prenyltransferase [Thermodesulfobacteriota bacterium]
SIKIIPSKLVGLLKFERLKDIPGSKTLFIAIGWATVTSLFPIVGIRKELSVSAFVAFLFMAVLVFIRTAIFDTWNIQGDQIVGKETIPTVLGEKKTLQLLNILEVSIGTLIIIATIGKWIPHFGYLLIIPVAYLYMCQKLYEKRSIYPSIRAERMVERTFIITGLLSFVGVYMSQAGSG